MRVFSRTDVRRAVSMERAIEVVRDAFAELARGTGRAPLRAAWSLPGDTGILLSMPGWLGAQAAMGAKLLAAVPANPGKGIGRVQGLVVLMDASTGRVRAVLEGAGLTALRTGAASGVATDALARTEAKTLAVFGTGPQARTQLEAVCAVRKIERAWVYSRRPEAVQEFILGTSLGTAEHAPKELLGAKDPAQAVADADIICAATNSTTPVFAGREAKAGVHVNAIGAYTPTMRELDGEFLYRVKKLVVDSREAAWAEAGDLIQARDEGVLKESDVYAELGELCAGLKPKRESDEEITLFKSVGHAVQDLAIAVEVLRVWKSKNLGVEVPIE